MKSLKRDLESVVKNLKTLTQKTERMAKELAKLEKAKDGKKPKRKARAKATPARKAPKKKAPVRKGRKLTATDRVLRAIQSRKRGVDTAIIVKKTGLEIKQIRPIVPRLKKQGKIKSPEKGIYIAA